MATRMEKIQSGIGNFFDMVASTKLGLVVVAMGMLAADDAVSPDVFAWTLATVVAGYSVGRGLEGFGRVAELGRQKGQVNMPPPLNGDEYWERQIELEKLQHKHAMELERLKQGKDEGGDEGPNTPPA